MCGILGIVRRHGLDPADLEFVRRGTACMAHRGPDGQGLWSDTHAGFGHRRLAVIDLETGTQPMQDTTGRFTIVFNGEIYNYRELRDRLQATGSEFRTQSDTEVLLNAYARWGVECLGRLDGIFAFGIWDARERSLFLARDALGVKPLLYHAGDTLCLFASELKPLALHPSVGRDVDPLALSDFLSIGYVLAPKTIFRRACKLQPASWLKWQDGTFRTGSFWNLPARLAEAADAPTPSRPEATEALRKLLDRAVRSQLVSDVPVGTFLSGGIDSTAVTERMARFYPDTVQTFSIGFPEASYSELPYADLAARCLGTEHHVETVHPDLRALLPALAWYYDEPFADTSATPTYLLCRLARRYLKVVLSGDGGDEAFAGYDTYVADKVRSFYCRVPDFLHRRLVLPLARRIPATHRKVSWDYRLRQFCIHAHESPEQAHYSWRLLFSEEEKRHLIAPDLLREIGDYTPFDVFRGHFEQVRDLPFLNQAQYVDLKTWLADCMLVKVDRASMACGLEVRVPLLAPDLVAFALGLPPDFKLRGLRTKAIFRDAVAHRVPRSILRRRKRGFNAPVSHWIRSLDTARFVHDTPELPGVSATWQRLIEEHRARRTDAGFKLWALLTGSIWDQVVRTTPDHVPGTLP